MRKKFAQTALGRTILGRNTAGKTLHAVLDVAPIPNFHEVAKAVIKDNDKRETPLSAGMLVTDFVSRIDWVRTAIGLAIAYLLVTGKVDAETLQHVLSFLGTN
jgi:hypothetical protein